MIPLGVKGDGSVWHAQKGSHLRYSMLRWDFCFLQTCQTEPSPLTRQKCGMGTRAGWVDEGRPNAVNSIMLRG